MPFRRSLGKAKDSLPHERSLGILSEEPIVRVPEAVLDS
jgi:hypothetical protein